LRIAATTASVTSGGLARSKVMMFWGIALIVIVAFFAAIEWTSKPRSTSEDTPAADPGLKIPQPRSAEHDRSVRFTRPL
jgi:hypothetical protein